MTPHVALRLGPAGAPPVVLLHPIATHSAIWAPQLPVLSQRHEVFALDLPGHGRAGPAEDGICFEDLADGVLDALDRLGIGRFALVGLSFGGMVAQAVALRRPDRVRALVLAHTSCRTAPPVARLWEDRLCQLTAGGMAAQVAPALDRWFTPAFLRAAPETVAWVGQLVRETSEAGYRTAVRAIQRLDHAERLGTLHMPALVIAGRHDTALPLAVSEDLTGRLPGGQLEVLPSAHLGNVECPVAFTEAVGYFLRQAA